MPNSQPPPESEMHSLDTGTAQYAGAFFPCSERLLISGGVFTSNITNITQGTPPLPPDFRMIPMGDIYLRRGVVLTRNCARRLYSARIEGKQTDMTVAMYQGDNAEKKWHDDLSKYLWLRHPNFLQVYGAAISAGIHVIILHDELMLWDDFECLYRHSHSMMVHIYAQWIAEFKGAVDYFESVFHRNLEDLDPIGWIDLSNGRLCADIVSNHSPDDNPPSSQEICPMAPLIDNVILLNEYHRLFPPLTLEQYHSITYEHFDNAASDDLEGSVPPIHLASILCSSEGLKAICVEDATNPVIIATNPAIIYERRGTEFRKVMANDWERYESNDFAHNSIYLEVKFERPESWLSQATRIFDPLDVTSKTENYALVSAVEFELSVFHLHPSPLHHGYLFVCPPEDFRLPGTSSFRWPDCPAYWSFDPTGAERLSTEAAMRLGFPALRFRTRVKLKSWDDNVYAGLREFHDSRGFDPDSEDMSRDLGYLIYKLPDAEHDEDLYDSPIHENTVQGLQSVHLATLCGPEEFVPLSRPSKVLMAVKFALILFIAVCGAYNGVRA